MIQTEETVCIHKACEGIASMASSKAAWLVGDEEKRSFERKKAGDSIILSCLSCQGF